MTKKEESRAQTAQMQQATPLMQRQQREADKRREDEKARERKQDGEKKKAKSLPNLAEVLKEQGVQTDPNESAKKIANKVENSSKNVEQSIIEEGKKSNRVSEESIDETKKTNKLLTRIIKASTDSIKKGALEAGNEGLENTKETVKGSFGEFGLLAQNLVKTAYAAIKKVSQEKDEEEERKGTKNKTVARVEKESVTEELTPPVPTPTQEAPKAQPVAKPKPVIKPIDLPEPIHEVEQPSKVSSKLHEEVDTQPESPTPKIERVATPSYPEPIHEVEQPNKVWSKRPQTAPIQNLTLAPTPSQKAPEPLIERSPIDRKGKTPQQVRIERMHRRENIVPSDSKDEPKLERLNRKQRKKQKLEDKKAEKSDPPKELVEMNKSLEKLVTVSEDQLKAQRDAELSKNSNELQASKPDKDNKTDKLSPTDDKKSKGMLSGVLGSLFEGLIGSISSGKGIIGIVGSAITSVLGVVGKLVKPIGGFVTSLAKSGKLIPIIGQVVAVIAGIFDFFDGWQNAADILGKDGKLLTIWDKFSAGVGSVLGGLVSLVDDVLGFFGIETKFGDTIKKSVASFLADLPNKISGMFDTVIKSVDDLTGGFASNYIAAIKSFWTSALKGLLSVVPGGDKLSSYLGLDSPDKAPVKAPDSVSAVPKASTTFAPRAEANASAIRTSDQAGSNQAGTTVVAPTNNTQVVNNNSYSSGMLTTRNNNDSHRYGLTG